LPPPRRATRARRPCAIRIQRRAAPRVRALRGWSAADAVSLRIATPIGWTGGKASAAGGDAADAAATIGVAAGAGAGALARGAAAALGAAGVTGADAGAEAIFGSTLVSTFGATSRGA